MYKGVAAWADRCARNNPPQAFVACINLKFEKGPHHHKLSGEETVARLLKLGVDPDDIEVTNE